jgi:hypothetical protein
MKGPAARGRAFRPVPRRYTGRETPVRIAEGSLPPQPRPRSLLRLEAEIGAADAARARRAPPRQVLLRGEEGHGDDEPARHEEGRPSRGSPSDGTQEIR